jgi:hypothetical protein
MPFENPGFSIGTFAVCFLCFVTTLFLLARVRGTNSIVVIEAKHIPAELLSYTIPYIVAFMSIGYQDTGKFVGLLIFLGWMFWITYKSGQIILNPVLAAFGWKLYELTYRFPGSQTPEIARALAAPAVEVGKSYAYVVFQDVVIIRSSQENAVDHLG